MVSGTISPIEGCRRICRLRFDVGDPDSSIFLLIRAVDSETDHFPFGEVRVRFAPDYLKVLDEERDAYLASARDDIIRSCLQLVEVYALPA